MRAVYYILFYSGLDILISGAIAQIAPAREKWILFFACLGVLWLLPWLTALWYTAKFWLAYHVFLKRMMVRQFKAQFHEHGIPSAAGHFDNMQFLSYILDDPDGDIDQKAKFKAAFYVGEFTAMKSLRAFTMGIAWQSAFEQAMEEYRPELRL